jgi:hypothetical protein
MASMRRSLRQLEQGKVVEFPSIEALFGKIEARFDDFRLSLGI